jgi:hypothetical protein
VRSELFRKVAFVFVFRGVPSGFGRFAALFAGRSLPFTDRPDDPGKMKKGFKGFFDSTVLKGSASVGLNQRREAHMTEYKTIEIDFDVHKAIEQERLGFSEHPNLALRRLLKLGPANDVPPGAACNVPPGGRGWAGKGVTLPHRTIIQMEYNNRKYEGVIDNGDWLIDGKRFPSPSAAASGVAVTKNGKHTSLDGWVYWRVKLPGQAEWVALSHLRR